ncbi:PREDICTED: probable serine/threonine-protein kinase DDB_G0271682 [Amphimedon queenslandica]|uniref:Protein kinase domain-containing protein n=2 Tax=Amphimedon queenslandica TaxID=400682 RepID=A0AAN0J9R9_AMPQE|nr:PREDICTED: probable serine/threonine-protein kinase DDB_G0271682 [Amphimedon queenslandica]|eukprot:XP_019853471.1 PREDICTED: probable serine/threonine-protein kinase DDB_G0271682 [Amphimedon queenslandica]
MLVISGGKDDDTLDDCWIFNITQHSWIKLDVPHSVSKRWGHSLSSFSMSSPLCVWIITVGGQCPSDSNYISKPNVAMLNELVTNSKGQWAVGSTLDTNDMNNEEYKKRYQHQLQIGGRMWLEEFEQAIEEKEKELQERKRRAQVFCQQLEQKEREEAKKAQEIRRYRHQLQKKDREEAEREERYHNQLQEKDRELQEKDRALQEKDVEHQVVLLEKDREHQVALQEKDRELQEKDEELHQSQDAVRRYQQQAELTDDHWVINKDEVILTDEELGRGSYAVVTVGIFRGLRVAVKSLHTIIISDYNLALFSREMTVASQIRHPNLVQFIGATKVGNPLILTELMSTSLSHQLQKKRLTNKQILSIAQDVALGLNYLHLFQPPIIHRDVSSPNVLLKPCTGPAGYEAKVADYGTVKVVQATTARTGTGPYMAGNPAYAAPEARDPDQHSPAMDVYSYSVLLMEMNLCRPPEMETARRARQSGSVSWSDMKSLIQRGLDNNPKNRPTMAQVLEFLKRIKI